MKFLTRILLASLGIFFLMPSFLLTGSEVHVVTPESAGCFTGIRCDREPDGAWACFRDPSALQGQANVLSPQIQASSHDRLDAHFVSAASEISYGSTATASEWSHISRPFAFEYVGIVKIQV